MSTIALVWNFMRDLRDNPRVKIEISLKRVAHDGHGRPYAVGLELEVEGASEQVFVHFNIVNVGRRKVTLTGMGGDYYKGKKHFVIPTPYMLRLPLTLEEGQEAFEINPNLDLLGDNTKSLFFWNTTGKYWRVSWWNLRKVRKEAKNYTVKAS